LLITVVLAAEVNMYLNLKGCDLMRTAAGSHHVFRNIEQNLFWEMILGWLNLTALILSSSMVQMRNAEGLHLGNLKVRDHLGDKNIDTYLLNYLLHGAQSFLRS
jgi:hypothetical protein